MGGEQRHLASGGRAVSPCWWAASSVTSLVGGEQRHRAGGRAAAWNHSPPASWAPRAAPPGTLVTLGIPSPSEAARGTAGRCFLSAKRALSNLCSKSCDFSSLTVTFGFKPDV